MAVLVVELVVAVGMVVDVGAEVQGTDKMPHCANHLRVASKAVADGKGAELVDASKVAALG
jgi:hypothetical protein